MSLLAYDNGKFSLMTEPSGLERCGGIDIDRMIFDDMQKCIDPEILASIVKDPKKAMRLNVQLSELAVKAKHHLSTASVYEEYIEVGMDDFEYTLTLDKLNTMIAGMVGQTVDVCRKMVEDAGIKVKDLSAILMVGGTSRVPLVQTMVKQMAAGVPVYCSADVDLAVARGALMFAKGEAPQTLEKIEDSATAMEALRSGILEPGKVEKTEKIPEKVSQKAPEKAPERLRSQGLNLKPFQGLNLKLFLARQGEGKSPGQSEIINQGRVGAKSDFQTGLRYYNGDRISQSYTKALKFFARAAEKGHSDGAWYLGKCLEEGTGVGKDNLLAQRWYEKAKIYAQEWPETSTKYKPKPTPDVTALVRKFIQKYPGIVKGKDDFLENSLDKIKKHLEIPSSEVVLLAHNDTVFGGGKNAYVLTNRGIYSRDLGEPRLFMDWKAFMECKITPLGKNKNFFGGKIFCAHVMGNMGEKMQTFWPALQKYLQANLK